MYFGVSDDPKVEDVRDAFPALGCGLCKFFKVNADREESLCKRLDHKQIRFYHPWFKSYDCGQFSQNLCADFKPNFSAVPALEKIWCGVDAYVGNIPEAGTTALYLGGDTNVQYKVRTKDFYDGSFMNGDSIRCVEKSYYKIDRKSTTGYRLVREHFDTPEMIHFGADISSGEVTQNAV